MEIRENEIKSPYDLTEMLWFILPGATLLISIFLFEFWINTNIVKDSNRTREIDSLTNMFITSNNDTMTNGQKQWLLDALVKIPFHNSDGNKNNNLYKKVDSLYEKYSYNDRKLSAKQIPDSLRYALISLSKYLNSKKREIHTPIYSAIMLTKASDIWGWILSAVYILTLLSVCYVAGHIIYMIASFVYERILIMKGFAYPYEKILNLNNSLKYKDFKVKYNKITNLLSVIEKRVLKSRTEWFETNSATARDYFYLCSNRYENIKEKIKKSIKNEISMGFYKGTFFWIYLYFSTIYVLFILNLDFLNERQSLFSGSIVLKGTVITFIIFFFLLFIFFVLKSIITSEVQSRDFRRKGLMSFFIRDYPFAVNFVDSLTKNFLHTQCEFDPPFIKNYGEKFYNVFGLDYRVHSKQNYWLSKFYVMEKSEYLNKQLSYWEKIYRFSKSLAAAFGLAAIYCSLSIFFQEDVLKKLGAVYYYEIEVSHILPLILLGLNLITLQYYIYIYDNRYSRLIFRTFIAAVATDEFEFRKQAILTGSQKKSFVLKRDR